MENKGNLNQFFDWNHFCYQYIPDDQRVEQKKLLEKILDSEDESSSWAERIRKRGNVFFMII